MLADDFTAQIRQKSDDELLAILADEENYQPEFIRLVREESGHRQMNLQQLDEKKQAFIAQRNETLSKGRPGDPGVVLLGFIFTFLGGLIGLFIGLRYWKKKEYGFYVYDRETREKGMIMVLLFFLVMVVYIIAAVNAFSG